jgi:prephenate dehydrogenase
VRLQGPRRRRAGRAGARTVAIAGLGLVGGSLARVLARAGVHVIGVDRPPVLRQALRARAIVGAESSLARAAAAADLVVLAAPPKVNLRLLRLLSPAARPGLVITDVSSVKQPIVREARRLRLRGFVGGHPVAGNEGKGFAASSPDLFRDRAWILTPGHAEPAAVRTVRALVGVTGARPTLMSARDHDHALAFLSHLPQMVAWAILAAARDDQVARRVLGLAGPGFRDMTRLAKSPRPLWREILAENQAAVRRALAGFRRALVRSDPR